MKRLQQIFLALALGIIVPVAQAGWVVTEEIKSGSTTSTHTYHFQKDMVKYSMKNLEMILDVKTGNLTLINLSKKIFWNGTIKQFEETMKSGIDQETQNMLMQLSPQEQEQYKQMMKELQSSPSEPAQPKTPLIIKPTQAVEKIAGYNGTKYDIRDKDRLLEEIWIAQTFTLRGEVDIQRMSDFMTIALAESGLGTFYGNDYVELLKKGYPLRSIKHIQGGALLTEVTGIEQKELPESVFKVSNSFTPGSINEVIAGE